MVFDLSLHPGHKSLRMSYRDYAAAGIYFVTICTYDRRPTLAKIEKGTVHLSSIGTIVKERWLQIPTHHPQTALHSFVVMPNHFHGLLELTTHVDVPANSALTRREFGPNSVPSASLSAIVRSFKSGVTKHVRETLSVMGEIWQRNYFERAIRSGKDFDAATQYIIENPLRWEMDQENPERVKTRRPR